MALMALAVSRLLASEPLPSWPGLTRPSTPRRLRDESRQRRERRKGFRNKTF